jgi:L-amino acid N-acyltransferase YncA
MPKAPCQLIAFKSEKSAAEKEIRRDRNGSKRSWSEEPNSGIICLQEDDKMESKVELREYRPEDLEQVLELVRELESELEEKFKTVQIQSVLDDYRNRYLKPGNKYKTFVAITDDKVVGYLMGYPSLGAPEIDRMYDVLPLSPGSIPPEFYLQMTFVSKLYRNRGISKGLHIKIIVYAKNQGHKEVYACIAKWNLPEIKVIRSLRFHLNDLGYRYRLTLKF